MKGRIVIITGPPGAGKSTIARRLAEGADAPLAIHLHTDDFYTYVRKGFEPPWLPESAAQNRTIMQALTRAAGTFAGGGYDVFVDGIVAPRFIEPWLEIARQDNLDLRYIILLPDAETTVVRAIAREGEHALRDAEAVKEMHRQLTARDDFRAHWIDTSALDAQATCALIARALAEGRFRLR